MEKIKFILRENVDRWSPEGKLLPGKVSTLGFKITVSEEIDGSYFVINKPTVTAKDIVNVLNDVVNEMFELHEKLHDQTHQKHSNPKIKHGTWKKHGNEKICSECGFIYYSNNDDFNFCPNCGDVKNSEVIEKKYGK